MGEDTKGALRMICGGKEEAEGEGRVRLVKVE
jgi:guanyl-specific ribonuclease Sa